MSRSKYHPHRKIIIEMHKAGKTAEEIARYINDEHPRIAESLKLKCAAKTGY